MSTNQLAACLRMLRNHTSVSSNQIMMIDEALAAFEASGPDTAEAPGELDPRMALDTARKMLTYAQSFNGQKFDSMLDSVDRRNLAVALENLEETAAMLLNQASRLYEQSDAGAETCQNCGDLRYPGCKSELQGEPACRFWPARAALATPPLQTPAAPMTLNEFCAEADRIGLTADVLAAQLAERPEFADCVKAPSKVFESHALEQASKSAQVTMKPYRDAREATYREDLKHATLIPVSPLQEQDKRDGGRYRWLLSMAWGIPLGNDCFDWCMPSFTSGWKEARIAFDTVIDSAILAKSQGVGAEALPDMEAGGKPT